MKTESLRASRKSQAPNPREIAIIKSQTKTSPGRSQFWSFGLGTYLGFGIWCLELLFFQNSFAQGPLTPPAGPPAPTMKTLVEVEPRTNLQATPAPAGVVTTDANYHFIINQPGSYYLSANLGVTKPNGIQINAEGVTLDLNGFQISRSSGTGGNGIEIGGTRHRASVRNGSIRGFANGIQSVFDPDSGYALSCAFRDIVVSGCTTAGIFAGYGTVLESCRAHGNSGSYGIAAGNGSSLTNCSASDNTANHGIYADFGSSLANCSAYDNTAQYGIYANSGSSLANCSAFSNQSAGATSAGIGTGSGVTITHCSARSNTSTAGGTFTPTNGMGFDLGSGNTIQNCTAASNQGDGINTSSSCVVRDNLCVSNGASGDGAGIHSTSAANRIEGNNVTGNDRGIDVDGTGSLVIKNSARGNFENNYDIAADNRYGTIFNLTAAGSAAASGDNATGTLTTTTNPWANFAY